MIAVAPAATADSNGTWSITSIVMEAPISTFVIKKSL
jgi:hypothetical protein